MQLSDLHKKLIATARANPPGDGVPLAFEKRIMALVADKKPLDSWALWGSALSRSAVFCVVLMALLAAGSRYLLSANNTTSLSQDVEMTLFAAVDNNPEPIGETR